MYIQVTVDLQNYTGEVFDLQISNYLSVKKVIEIVWQVKKIEERPKEGYWIRVQNKELVCPGYDSLVDAGITTGDRVEVL
ncbi:EsaB/YukD family protein [Peribacillus glennii]|uniref:Ubiquitin n=1 Tax=Peribacillus glennii TaxID=2303991 RepID=A0A372LD78_9BACI|nr:EsaB/YukD family protein [Peribacillus glennii]RFU63104.1 ubiquitin [Peribacillus glennii]